MKLRKSLSPFNPEAVRLSTVAFVSGTYKASREETPVEIPAAVFLTKIRPEWRNSKHLKSANRLELAMIMMDASVKKARKVQANLSKRVARRYEEQHLIECFFNKAKNYRRVATRYEKTANMFKAYFTLLSIRLWLK
ncbi:hypothetical protein [Paenibacillus sp. 1P03SA]|uniref:hypothetical protein n=1 Tax=Paenibacillus sp. 1P03SA TaxID=3132294 RepID=UPI00399FAC6E